jgi:hypothetical protein
MSKNEWGREGETKPPVEKDPNTRYSLKSTRTITFWKQKKKEASRTIRKPITKATGEEG